LDRPVRSAKSTVRLWTPPDPPSYLRVSATNIVNEGILTAGSGGLMKLAAPNVDLSRSGLQIAPVPALRQYNNVFTIILSGCRIYDYFWVNQPDHEQQPDHSVGSLIVSPLNRISYTPVQLPINPPYPPFNPDQVVSFLLGVGLLHQLPRSTNWSSTNQDMSTTNVTLRLRISFKRSLWVAPVGHVEGVVRFFDSDRPAEPFQDRFGADKAISTNLVTVAPEQASIYFVDSWVRDESRFLHEFTRFTMPARRII